MQNKCKIVICISSVLYNEYRLVYVQILNLRSSCVIALNDCRIEHHIKCANINSSVKHAQCKCSGSERSKWNAVIINPICCTCVWQVEISAVKKVYEERENWLTTRKWERWWICCIWYGFTRILCYLGTVLYLSEKQCGCSVTSFLFILSLPEATNVFSCSLPE